MGKLYYQGPNGDILVSESSIPNLKKDKTLTEVVKDDIKEKSETMFKTINGESIIGEGNIVIEGGSGEGIPGGTANNLEVTGTSFKANVTEGISLKTHFDHCLAIPGPVLPGPVIPGPVIPGPAIPDGSEEAVDAWTENHIQLDSHGIALGREYYYNGSSSNIHASIDDGGFEVGINNEEGNKAIFATWYDPLSHQASFMIDGEVVPANYLRAPLPVNLDLDETSLESLGITEKLYQLENNKNYNEYHCEVALRIVSGETESYLSRVPATLCVNNMEGPVIPGILHAKPVKPTNPATSTARAEFYTSYGPIHAEFEFAEGSWTVTNLDLSNFRNPFDSSSAGASDLVINSNDDHSLEYALIAIAGELNYNYGRTGSGGYVFTVGDDKTFTHDGQLVSDLRSMLNSLALVSDNINLRNKFYNTKVSYFIGTVPVILTNFRLDHYNPDNYPYNPEESTLVCDIKYRGFGTELPGELSGFIDAALLFTSRPGETVRDERETITIDTTFGIISNLKYKAVEA